MSSSGAVGLDHSLIDRVIANKFRIRRCVGLGASGAVYLADQATLGRTVAIKVLRPELADDPKIVGRFHDEALAASRLNHPNTISIIDYGQTPDGLLYMAMEYLRGDTLTQLVQNEFPMEPARIANITSQILSGLEEAHACGVIHADLKSDNIIVEHRRGGWDLAKVLDFGVARILGVTKKDVDDKTICGTPEYMAPEIIAGHEATIATDIYAVGIILYELITGATPFGDSDRVLDILTRQIKELPAPPSSRRSDLLIDAELEKVVLRALAKQPGERFKDTEEFRHALEASHTQGRVVAANEVRCHSCGVQGASSFKFCPQCGASRPDAGNAGTSGVAILDAGLDAGLDSALVPAPSVLGIFPLPFCAREGESERLSAFITGGTSESMVQLVAERGGGRSRLARDVCNRHGADIVTYAAGPDPSGLATPFYAIRAMVAAVLELPAICTYEQIQSALESKGLSRRDLPGIGELFGHEGELWQLEPPVRKRELHASTLRVLRTASNRGRAVLLFEDVDQFDNPSQELLRRLGESVAGQVGDDFSSPDDTSDGLRIIVTNSPEFAERWGPSVLRIDLPNLAATDVGGLVGYAADYAADAGVAIATSTASLKRFTDLAGGSPAMVDQLLRYAWDGGTLTDAPTSCADLVAARIALLPHQARVVCQAAAVFGSEVERLVLDTALATEVGIDAIDEAVSILVARGVLSEEPPVLRFCDRLMRDVVYDATPADVRRRFHASAAAALEGVAGNTGNTGNAAALGHHHDLAGNLADAAELLAQAGDIHVHSFDDVGAARLYQRGLSAARQLMLASDSDEERAQFVALSVKLADTLRIGGEAALARGVIQEASAYCQDAPALAAQLLRASAHLSLSEGEPGEGISTVRRAIGQTIPTGQTEVLCDLYLDLSSMLLRDARSSTASSELEEAIDMVTLGEGAEASGGPPNLWRLVLRLAQLHAALDNNKRAVFYGKAALSHARRVDSSLGAARVLSMLAAHFERCGNLAEAASCREQAVAEMRRLGDRRGTAELLLQGVTPTRTLRRVSPESLREARILSLEVGWQEGVSRAKVQA